jgi:nucleoside-diphosphate-sugar epimerase
MKKILLSGATGFVGSNISKYLIDRNYCVDSIKIKSGIHPSILGNCDVFIHLAGKAHDVKDISDPSEYYLINSELTKNLYDDYLNSSTSTFIYFSSVKASADEVSGILLETDIPNPKTHYGKSKLMAEEYILSKKIPESKRVYILRPCMIHGPGNKGNLNLLFHWVKKGYPWPLGAFDNQRSFCSIENVSFVVNELLTRTDIPSGIYNLADNETLSTNQLIKLIGQALHKELKIWNINPHVIRFFASVGDMLKLPLNSERLHKLTSGYVVSNEKLLKSLGKPLPMSAQNGMTHTLTQFID